LSIRNERGEDTIVPGASGPRVFRTMSRLRDGRLVAREGPGNNIGRARRNRFGRLSVPTRRRRDVPFDRRARTVFDSIMRTGTDRVRSQWWFTRFVVFPMVSRPVGFEMTEETYVLSEIRTLFNTRRIH